MVQAIAMSTTTALVAARAGQTRVSRAKSVVARCVIPTKPINPRLKIRRYNPFFPGQARRGFREGIEPERDAAVLSSSIAARTTRR
jgi:hypothetical protein